MSNVGITVLGILRRGDELLVQQLTDPAAETFHRPIGGGVEFGEPSDVALEREFLEELGVGIDAGPTVATMENRFSWDGEPAHELVIVREAEFVDESMYDRERFDGVDAGGTVEYEATWKALDALAAPPEPLYPEPLAAVLREESGEGTGHVTRP